MKKVLILGGYTHMIDVVKTANQLGLYTIVIDRDIASPAKAYADKSYDISTSDISALAKVAELEKIDGVFNGFDDINTWHALALCKRLNLPFYATEEQLEICSNKDRFKEYCRNYAIPVIEEYDIDKSLKEEDLAKITFPVIIKPVDSYASQGITVCYSAEELREGYKKAVEYSKSEKVIVERFIDNPYGVMMFYTVCNGSIVLSAMTDRYVHKQYQEHPPLPTATTFPSQHLDLYLAELDKKVRAMLRGMEIENGVLFIQSLFEDGAFYFYEMGFRLSGTQYYTIVEKQTGINLLEMMLDYSTGGNLDKYAIEKYDNGYTAFPACNLSILLDKGVIKEIIGLEKILEMSAVLSYIQVHEKGDKIEITGTYAQMLGRFNIVAGSKEDLDQIIQEINQTLRVLSSEDKEMILTQYTPAKNEDNALIG